MLTRVSRFFIFTDVADRWWVLRLFFSSWEWVRKFFFIYSTPSACMNTFFELSAVLAAQPILHLWQLVIRARASSPLYAWDKREPSRSTFFRPLDLLLSILTRNRRVYAKHQAVSQCGGCNDDCFFCVVCSGPPIYKWTPELVVFYPCQTSTAAWLWVAVAPFLLAPRKILLMVKASIPLYYINVWHTRLPMYCFDRGRDWFPYTLLQVRRISNPRFIISK
jgi:hypothetical protein